MNQPDRIIEKFKWTDHRVQILKDMAARKVSSTIIGREVGCSRNAVIGKAFRLNIPLRGRYKDESKFVPKNVSKKYNQLKTDNATKNLAFTEMTETRKTLDELEPMDCRFPIADNYFCGAYQANHSSYCLDHHILCHKENQITERKNG